MDDLSNAAGLDFRAILDAAPDGMVLVETDGRILLANQEMEALFGYSREELIGQPVEMLVPRASRQGHPELRDSYMQESQARGMAGGRILSGLRKDGTPLPISISLSVTHAGAKEVVLATVRDLTVQARETAELRRQTLESTLLLRAADIAAEAETVNVALRGIIDAVCAATGWPIGHAYTVCPKNPDTLLPGDHWCLGESDAYRKFRDLGKDQVFCCGEGLPGRVLQSGEVAWIEDIEQDANFTRTNAAQAAGVRSAFAIPVSLGGEVEGVLEFFAAEVLPRDEEFVQIMGKVGEQLSRVFERSKAQREIVRREQLIESMIQNVPGAVYRYMDHGEDSGGQIMELMTEEIESICGMPPAHFINHGVGRIGKLICPNDQERVQQTVMAAMQSGDAFDIEYQVIHADGHLRWVNSRGKCSVDQTTGRTIVDGTLFDVTERKEAELTLKAAQLAAEQANIAKSAFLANMSHELRTPLNAILGYSEMLMEEAEDLEQDVFGPDLKKIKQAGSHLLALINDVLDLSKIEAGKAELFGEEVNVSELLDEVTATVAPLVARNGNSLKLVRDEDPGSVFQDLTKLKQCLLNLLSNAAKFTHDGEVTLRVGHQSTPGGEMLVLSVADTGIGIPADKMDSLFEEFTQADVSTTRKYGGTGLGLTISRRFCRMLGGDITVRSEPGQGSEFTIAVPVALPGAERPAQPAAAVRDVATELAKQTDAAPAPGQTILVVDDDPEACEIIERFLVRDGFDVVTATSGEEGLRLAHELRPAAITLDVMMPDMDGWAVLRAIKADPHLAEIPVVMVTMVDDKSRGYSLGATDYLTKPVERDALVKALLRYRCERGSCPVMVVEDDADTRALLARTLQKDGWAVNEAANGQEALEVMERQAPGLVLLDLMMPVMDGFQFLHEMRQHEAWQNIPVIVVTAKDLTPEDQQKLDGSVEQILAKGAYGREQLIQNIRRLVASSGAAAQ